MGSLFLMCKSNQSLRLLNKHYTTELCLQPCVTQIPYTSPRVTHLYYLNVLPGVLNMNPKRNFNSNKPNDKLENV